ncbi:MAG: hypothetical protein IPL90_00025 [Holophagales bacterium]|nr:hypothetical protein [Holophagales bacterium]
MGEAGVLLLFGRGRLIRFPDAWIQAGRFSGTDKVSIVDHADLEVSRSLYFRAGS